MTNKKSVSHDRAVDLMKAEVDRALRLSPAIIREYMLHLKQGQGKYIRALSLIACAQNKEDTVHINAVYLAAAVEVLHLATLVHDDVIDNADKRRGNLSLQKKYGKRCAVICGDYLFCVALKLASKAQDKEKYLDTDITDYMSRICLGELQQYINNNNLDLSVYRYFKIISGKTAALFEASFHFGAILSESDTVQISKYSRLGRYVGMVFQLTDDCMNFEAVGADKKPVQSDYQQGVITLPLIYAFDKINGLKQKAKAKSLSISDLYQQVIKAGGTQYTRTISKRYSAKALKIIDELTMTAEKRERLISILEKAAGGK